MKFYNNHLSNKLWVFFALAFAAVFTSSCGSGVNLPASEIALLERVDFDAYLLSNLRNNAGSNLNQLQEFTEELAEESDKLFPGVYVVSTEEKARKLVALFKNQFRAKGYLIFMFDSNGEYRVGVIKSDNELDILKYRKTSGTNYDVFTEDIYKKLLDWDRKYGMQIIGCGTDWIHVYLNHLPADLSDISNEIYEFCPDSVNQGVGSIENLTIAIKQLHGIWLWWD